MTTTATHPARHADHDAARSFEEAERSLLDEYGVTAASRRVLLSDPALTVRVLETGAGEPLVLLHGTRAAALMPDARVHVLPGGHAPFADDPQACATLIRSAS